jgi:hypothetical protein
VILLCKPEATAKAGQHSTTCPAVAVADADEQSTISYSLATFRKLLVYNLDLLIDYLPGKAVHYHACLAEAWRRRVHPVAPRPP